MALDVGGRRIGVAMSDTTRVLASPLTTLRAEPRDRVLSEIAEVQYKVSAAYDPKTECALSYADPELAVRWPLESPILSARDQAAEPTAASAPSTNCSVVAEHSRTR